MNKIGYCALVFGCRQCQDRTDNQQCRDCAEQLGQDERLEELEKELEK